MLVYKKTPTNIRITTLEQNARIIFIFSIFDSNYLRFDRSKKQFKNLIPGLRKINAKLDLKWQSLIFCGRKSHAASARNQYVNKYTSSQTFYQKFIHLITIFSICICGIAFYFSWKKHHSSILLSF